MNALSTDQKFKAGSLLILTIACILAGELVWSNARDYLRNLDNLTNLRLYHAALHAANQLSAERGPSNSLMGMSPGNNTEAQILQLATARAASDNALMALGQLAAQHRPLPFLPQHQLVDIHQLLRDARSRVDRLAALPLTERSGEHIDQAINGMFRVVDQINLVVTVIENHAAKADRSLSDAILMAQVVGNMREYAGRVGSLLMVPLIQQRPLALDRRRNIANLLGRLDEMNEQLNHQIGDYWDRPGMHEAREQVTQQYFGTGSTVIQTVLSNRNNGRYADTAASFTERYVPTMRAIEQLRDRIVDSGTNQAIADLKTARKGMLLAAVLACGIAAVVGTLLHLARHRLLSPLLRARQEIIALANGNYETLQRPPSGQEARKLFDAIDVLRTHQQQRDLLEKRLTLLTRQFKQQAATDPLTGVSNRRALDEMGEHLLLNAMPDGWQVGLLLLDIDHFKLVNDLHGHPAGDEVLRGVAQRVRSACRSEDNVGRFGGEEFTVLVARTDTNAARLLAEKLRQLIADTPIVLADGKALFVTASFGVALSNADSNWADLITAADQALYAAKRNGRNRVECAPEADPERSA
ncbi:diguanylate cyclase [Chitiniphilus eburneus]|uniref:GGDEF domain-containing protein n=1 Tax=Chitiniphilus eburneus TaxID=2571148 RepID=UPI0035CF5FD8